MNFDKRLSRAGLLASAATLAITSYAQADVTISSDATENMDCTEGICSPTATDAVLNANDLENLLATGNVDVTTTAAGVQAENIVMKAPVSWTSTSVLDLDAYHSITVDQSVTADGLSGITLITNDGSKNGELSFGRNGNIIFANLSSSLTINGAAYTLVNSVKTLAAAIGQNPNGNFALAMSYDAILDGTYSAAPVSTPLDGTFEGLGNTISNLSIKDLSQSKLGTALFEELESVGTIRDLRLKEAQVQADMAYRGKHHKRVGVLAADSFGSIVGTSVSGTVGVTHHKGLGVMLGGLVGVNEHHGTIMQSGANVTVSGYSSISAGGLVGTNSGTIAESYATGAVSGTYVGGLVGLGGGGSIIRSFATGAASGYYNAGGLVGLSEAAAKILQCYAAGAASTGGEYSTAGGLVGTNFGAISQAYSTGEVTGYSGADLGGLIGSDQSEAGSLLDTYWDTDTSGITNLSQGAGNIANDPGITGLTTEEFQAGLPQGFDPKIWNEKSNLNDGLPYLRAIPPKK